MANLIWLGDEDPTAQRISHGGYSFVKGEPVAVKDNDLWQFAQNPVFSKEKGADPVKAKEPDVQEADAGSEKAEIRKLLRDAGETVQGNPSLDTLRERLAKLTAPEA